MLFPPDPEVGALRVGKLSQWLCHDHDWQVHVVKRARSIAAGACSLDVASQTEVHAVKSYDSLTPIRWVRSFRKPSSSLAKGLTATHASGLQQTAQPNNIRSRGFLAGLSDLLVVPDNEQTWAWSAYRQLRRLVRQQQISVLFSSGPPHTAHLAAYWCKRRHGLPWVLDLRDPWCANPYGLSISPVANRVNERLESRCLELADRILANTEPARQLILDRYPHFADDKVVTLPNGIDEEDYAGLNPTPLWPATRRPVLIHAGSLYAKRDPTPLVHALAKLKTHASKNLPLLVFVGNWEPVLRQSVEEIIVKYDLGDDVLIYPAQPRRNSLEAQLAADALILIGDSEQSQLQIPAKLFESLYLTLPILSLFKSDSPVNEYLLKYCEFFVQSQPAETESIVAALMKLGDALEGMQQMPAPNTSVRPLHELSRRQQAHQLHAMLESLLETGDGFHK